MSLFLCLIALYIVIHMLYVFGKEKPLSHDGRCPKCKAINVSPISETHYTENEQVTVIIMCKCNNCKSKFKIKNVKEK